MHGQHHNFPADVFIEREHFPDKCQAKRLDQFEERRTRTI